MLAWNGFHQIHLRKRLEEDTLCYLFPERQIYHKNFKTGTPLTPSSVSDAKEMVSRGCTRDYHVADLSASVFPMYAAPFQGVMAEIKS